MEAKNAADNKATQWKIWPIFLYITFLIYNKELQKFNFITVNSAAIEK